MKPFPYQTKTLAEADAADAAARAAKKGSPRGYGEQKWPKDMWFEDAVAKDATGPVRMSGGPPLIGRSIMGGSFW